MPGRLYVQPSHPILRSASSTSPIRPGSAPPTRWGWPTAKPSHDECPAHSPTCRFREAPGLCQGDASAPGSATSSPSPGDRRLIRYMIRVGLQLRTRRLPERAGQNRDRDAPLRGRREDREGIPDERHGARDDPACSRESEHHPGIGLAAEPGIISATNSEMGIEAQRLGLRLGGDFGVVVPMPSQNPCRFKTPRSPAGSWMGARNLSPQTENNSSLSAKKVGARAGQDIRPGRPVTDADDPASGARSAGSASRPRRND